MWGIFRNPNFWLKLSKYKLKKYATLQHNAYNLLIKAETLGGDVDPPINRFLTDRASVGDLLQSKLLAEIVQMQVEKIC